MQPFKKLHFQPLQSPQCRWIGHWMNVYCCYLYLLGSLNLIPCQTWNQLYVTLLQFIYIMITALLTLVTIYRWLLFSPCVDNLEFPSSLTLVPWTMLICVRREQAWEHSPAITGRTLQFKGRKGHSCHANYPHIFQSGWFYFCVK